MGTGDNDRSHDDSDGRDFEEIQRLLRDMLSGNGGAASPADAEQFAKAAGIPIDPATLQNLFSTLQGAMQNPTDGIDWSVTRRTAIEVASDGTPAADPAPANRAFPVAALWLDEATDLGPTPDAPRVLGRIEWVQQSVDTWITLASPVAESITGALMSALDKQMPEELGDALRGAVPMLRSVGGALFAVQLGSIIGKLSGEIVSAGDIGIPLFEGPGREGGAIMPTGAEKFAEGLEQSLDTVVLYLAVRELAHARLFRHTKWLRLHLITAITDYARGISIDSDRIQEFAQDLDPSNPEEIQELIAGGALIPPKSEAQEAAHARLETMLALIEGWVDVVTADAAKRIPGADAIAEMVRRRRATGGPAEHAFAALVGLELRPRRLREAAALWRLVSERGGIAMRDGLWAHPDLLPTIEELDHPARLLERLGLAGGSPEILADDFDEALARLLDGDFPPHIESDDTHGDSGDSADSGDSTGSEDSSDSGDTGSEDSGDSGATGPAAPDRP